MMSPVFEAKLMAFTLFLFLCGRIERFTANLSAEQHITTINTHDYLDDSPPGLYSDGLSKHDLRPNKAAYYPAVIAFLNVQQSPISDPYPQCTARAGPLITPCQGFQHVNVPACVSCHGLVSRPA